MVSFTWYYRIPYYVLKSIRSKYSTYFHYLFKKKILKTEIIPLRILLASLSGDVSGIKFALKIGATPALQVDHGAKFYARVRTVSAATAGLRPSSLSALSLYTGSLVFIQDLDLLTLCLTLAGTYYSLSILPHSKWCSLIPKFSQDKQDICGSPTLMPHTHKDWR